MRNSLRTVGSAIIVLAVLMLAGYLAYDARVWWKVNFREVTPGRVYRAGIYSKDSLQRILKRQQIRTVVQFSGDVTPRFRAYDAFVAVQPGMRHVKMPRYVTTVPTYQDTMAVMAILTNDVNWPVLVHCEHGKDRTGYFIMLYRMLHDGWTWERALQEAADCRMRTNGRPQIVLAQMPALLAELRASNAFAQAP
jgi:protein tyrosine/serine phosphatase